MYVKNVNIIL